MENYEDIVNQILSQDLNKPLIVLIYNVFDKNNITNDVNNLIFIVDKLADLGFIKYGNFNMSKIIKHNRLLKLKYIL